MKIFKFDEFIKEDNNLINDTPENYIDMLLLKLKKRVDKMFQESETKDDDSENKGEISVKDARNNSKSKNHPTLKEYNLRLESSEISKHSQMNDNLTVKFSDDKYMYNLLISINTKNAIPTDKETDFNVDDIKQCYIKFKKYDIDTFDIIGQITRNINPRDIDEDFIIKLKLDLDEEFGSEDEEDFKIET